jgi:Tfp pilus assembly PilM family ATPase
MTSSARHPSETITQVLISGGASQMAGSPRRSQAAFSYPTEVLNPFKTITMGRKWMQQK